MPGVTLDAGTYVFKLADTPSRNVVQVWDRDEKKMIGHWLFVQADRPEVSQDTVVMFRETAAGRRPAVQFWYYPGERSGKEFVYPKDQALKIAARTNARVLSTEGDIRPESSVSSVDAKGNVTEWKPERRPPRRRRSAATATRSRARASRAAAAAAGPRAREPAPQPAPAPRAEAPTGRGGTRQPRAGSLHRR